ncbi:MAG: T9SS type A sorting domain-containing protein [Flavobacteriales bacterium]|nr:T9SS type A sorting domain-containing protein [Flavobacteriales bacterium]
MFTSVELPAQNLVINPSFEDTLCCPTSWDQTICAPGWTTNMNSWDLFNSCSFAEVSVPENFAGGQWPSSGNGYGGFIAWGPDPPGPYTFPTEIMGGTLSTPLQVGVQYYVSFKVSLGKSYVQCCSIDKLGLLFVSTEYGQVTYPGLSRPPIVQNHAHVYRDAFITDTDNWTTIEGTFIADAPYPYFLIGRFFTDEPDHQTCWSNLGHPNRHAYYYVDDVCVSPNRGECMNADNEEIAITYVPGAPAVSIVDRSAASSLTASLFDVAGRQVTAERSGISQLSIPVLGLRSGIYLVRARAGDAKPQTARVFVP